MEKKRTYFKLGGQASVFSDPAANLKVTRNVPGSTLKPESKLTSTAKSNGHIVEIGKDEFEDMMSKLTPGEAKAAHDEQGISYEEKKTKKTPKSKDEGKGDEDDEDDDDDDEEEDAERDALLEKLKAIKMTPTKRKEMQALGTPELKAFIEAEEKK